MSGWQKGRVEVDALVAARHLQLLPAAARAAGATLARAEKLISSAEVLLASDADSAYVLAYDAARQAGTAVLAAQGLRPTAAGGHLAVEKALKAQFAPGFSDFHMLRRRRNELEYPAPGRLEVADADETREAIAAAAEIVDQARSLVPSLQLY